MSPRQSPAGLRGARFQAVFARSRSAGIGWTLWGFLPHFLPQRRGSGSHGAGRSDFLPLTARKFPRAPACPLWSPQPEVVLTRRKKIAARKQGDSICATS